MALLPANLRFFDATVNTKFLLNFLIIFKCWNFPFPYAVIILATFSVIIYIKKFNLDKRGAGTGGGPNKRPKPGHEEARFLIASKVSYYC